MKKKQGILAVCETHSEINCSDIMLRYGRMDNVHAEGMALLLRKRVQKSLFGWDPLSPRELRASLNTNNKGLKMNIAVNKI